MTAIPGVPLLNACFCNAPPLRCSQLRAEDEALSKLRVKEPEHLAPLVGSTVSEDNANLYTDL